MGSASTTPAVTKVDIDSFCDTRAQDLFLHTGDLLLLSGSGIRARLISLCTWCRYSHIAIAVIPHEVFKDYTGPNEYYLLESSGSAGSVKCVCGSIHNGVRLVPMRDRLQEYLRESGTGELHACVIQNMHQAERQPAGVGVADADALAATPFFGLRQADCDKLCTFIKTRRKCGYDYTVLDTIDAVLSPDMALGVLHHAAQPSLHGYTCSSLVAAFYVEIGTLSAKLDLASVSPKSFYARERVLKAYMNYPTPSHNVTLIRSTNYELCITDPRATASTATTTDAVARTPAEPDVEMATMRPAMSRTAMDAALAATLTPAPTISSADSASLLQEDSLDL